MEESDFNTEIVNKFEEAKKLKSEGNSFLSKSDYNSAIESYNKAKEIISACLEKLKSLEKLNENLVKTKDLINRENIMVHSNLALTYSRNNMLKESAEYDTKIITTLDSSFDKSYVRLIQTYLKLDNMDNAVYYYILLKRTFHKETVEKHLEFLNKIKAENEKFVERVKAMEKSMHPRKTPQAGPVWSKNIIYILILIVGIGWFYYKNQAKPVEEPVF